MSADHALSSLSFPSQELERTASFLATAGDYAAFLLRRTGGGEDVTDEQRENLRALSEATALLAENLRQLRADMADGLVGADAVLAAESGLPALSDSFLQMEREFPEIPTLVYDGPFSSDRTERAPRMTADGKEIDADAAMLVAAGFLGVRSNQCAVDGKEEGRIPVWRIRAGDYTVCVSRKGGYVVRSISSRTPTRSVLSVPDALTAARKLMAARRYGELIESYHVTEGNVLTVTFCAGQDGVICYPDLVKLRLDLSDGRVIGFEAVGWLMSHRQREFAPAVPAETARAAVSGDLRILSEGLAVIPTDGKEERFCWEFKCEDAEGTHFIVYADALTGEEVKLLLLLEDENGTLVL